MWNVKTLKAWIFVWVPIKHDERETGNSLALTGLLSPFTGRMDAVEPPHVGPQLLDGAGTEGVAGGDQDAALVLDQPGEERN